MDVRSSRWTSSARLNRQALANLGATPTRIPCLLWPAMPKTHVLDVVPESHMVRARPRTGQDSNRQCRFAVQPADEVQAWVNLMAASNLRCCVATATSSFTSHSQRHRGGQRHSPVPPRPVQPRTTTKDLVLCTSDQV